MGRPLLLTGAARLPVPPDPEPSVLDRGPRSTPRRAPTEYTPHVSHPPGPTGHIGVESLDGRSDLGEGREQGLGLRKFTRNFVSLG